MSMNKMMSPLLGLCIVYDILLFLLIVVFSDEDFIVDDDEDESVIILSYHFIFSLSFCFYRHHELCVHICFNGMQPLMFCFFHAYRTPPRTRSSAHHVTSTPTPKQSKYVVTLFLFIFYYLTYKLCRSSKLSKHVLSEDDNDFVPRF